MHQATAHVQKIQHNSQKSILICPKIFTSLFIKSFLCKRVNSRFFEIGRCRNKNSRKAIQCYVHGQLAKWLVQATLQNVPLPCISLALAIEHHTLRTTPVKAWLEIIAECTESFQVLF